MTARSLFPPVKLADLEEGREADLFLLLIAREEGVTRDSKPFLRVTFRDATAEIVVPLWFDSPFLAPARQEWKIGQAFKIRCVRRTTSYGPQLELRKVREAVEADKADGYDPLGFVPRSRYDSSTMFAELSQLVEQHVTEVELRNLVLDLLNTHRETLLTLPAATHHHHAYVGGFLEHVLSVARTAVFLAEKYAAYYTELQPPLSKDLVVAGAVLHDIGKLRELTQTPLGGAYTPEGELIGHILQGRDLVRECAARHALDAETLLRLEHIVVSHQRTAEWGSPKPPMTPEALLVHYADDIDAKFHMVVEVLGSAPTSEPFTSRKNLLQQKFFRGLRPANGNDE